MRVNIDEIKEAGLDRAWDLATADVDEMVKGDPAGYRAAGPLHVTSKLRKLDRRVLLDATATASLHVPCGRCLTQVRLDVPLDLHMTFAPAAGARGGSEAADEGHRRTARGHAREAGPQHVHGEDAAPRPLGSFSPKDADEETYDGKFVELDPVVREGLLLAVPAYPVCNEACKGLCVRCGANLNDRECGCDRRVPDPRWAALDKLKAQDKEG